nr:RNA-directed DNA polymerase, eukaryota [Tanacetum cinerariifolium]
MFNDENKENRLAKSHRGIYCARLPSGMRPIRLRFQRLTSRISCFKKWKRQKIMGPKSVKLVHVSVVAVLRNVGNSSDPFKRNVGNFSGSFVSVLKSGKPIIVSLEQEVPSLVLDDLCFSERDFNLSLMGKVKDINALPNLYVMLEKEGFQNLKISYLGGMWVLIEMDYSVASKKFINHTEVASKWGELMKWENIEGKKFSRKQLCVRTKLNVIICEHFKVIIKGKVHWVYAKEMEACDPLFRNEAYDSSSSDEEDECENKGSLNGNNNESDKEVDRVSEYSCMHWDALFYNNINNKSMASKAQSEDPFNLYDILNKNKENDGNSKEGELKYPPGFTIMEATVNEVQEKEMEVTTEETKKGRIKELCVKNRVNFISLQGTKMECIELVIINKLLGNTSYDYEFSSSLEDTWMHLNIEDSNGMIKLKKKLQALKIIIKEWLKNGKKCSYKKKSSIQSKLSDFDKILDEGGSNEAIINDRSILLKELQDIISMESEEVAQKSKFLDEFDKLVEDTWMHLNIEDSNGMIKLKKKLQALKIITKEWLKNGKKCSYKKKSSIQSKLSDFDKILDEGGSNEAIINDRSILLKELQDIISMESEEVAQNLNLCHRRHWKFLENDISAVVMDFFSSEASGELSVKSARRLIEDSHFSKKDAHTRWVKVVPIKINVFAWRVRLDKLPTRLNLSLRGIEISSIMVPVCNSHLFFLCHVARLIWRKVLRWWNLEENMINSYDDWLILLKNIRLSKRLKDIFEEASGELSVKSARRLIEDSHFPKEDAHTRWVKVVPIKINVLLGEFDWINCLPD